MDHSRSQKLRDNLVVALATTTFAFLLLEGLASVLLSVRGATQELGMREESHCEYDSELGWRNRPNVKLPNLYGRGVGFSTNALGLRAVEDYSADVPSGRYRVVFLGDSFTMGYGVADDETYPAQIEALCPQIQSVNMGLGGYGLDQDYLWYKRDGERIRADALVVAFIAQDFYRMSDRRFLGYAKPVLKAQDGKLSVENVPVPRNWRLRTPLQRLGTGLNALAVLRAGRALVGREAPEGPRFYGEVSGDVFAAAELMFDDLTRLAAERGQTIVFAYLPMIDQLPQEPTREAQWIGDYGRRRHVPVVDLTPEFGQRPPWELARLFRRDAHYTPEGNRFVAGALLARLRAHLPLMPRETSS
jgi:hypothetical protein